MELKVVDFMKCSVKNEFEKNESEETLAYFCFV